MHEYPERRELGRGAGTWLAKQLLDLKSTRLNSSHDQISYAVFCLKKKKQRDNNAITPLSTGTTNQNDDNIAQHSTWITSGREQTPSICTAMPVMKLALMTADDRYI